MTNLALTDHKTHASKPARNTAAETGAAAPATLAKFAREHVFASVMTALGVVAVIVGVVAAVSTL